MRAVVQRVLSAAVQVAGEEVGAIATGLLVFVGVAADDELDDVRYMADKILGLRIFHDEQGKMNRCLRDVGGSVLVVSQFTLYGDVRRGRRPSFSQAARPEVGEPLYLALIEELSGSGIPVRTGRFGADMTVTLSNDGPVTILLDSQRLF